MPQRARLLLLVVLLGVVLCVSTARAEDPPTDTVDILAALHLVPHDDVRGLASANHLACTVGEGSPLEVFRTGDEVFLIALDRGSYRVVPDTKGVLACAVGETVHVLDFLSPRRALEALGLEPSDEPIPDGASRRTRVVDPERLVAHGITSVGKGALATVYGRSSGYWSISTFGRETGFGRVDAWAFYATHTPLGDRLVRATVTLDPDTLTEGGRLLARVEDSARLAAHGVRQMPPDELVRLRRGAGSAWTLTTLVPGFTVAVALDGLDLEALGLEDLRLLDLPVGGSVRGRLTYSWKARKEGLQGARPRDRMEVVRQEDGTYVLRDLEPRRPVSMPLDAS